MAEILKWSFLGLGALFVLAPICYYWFFKSPIVNKHIADFAKTTAKEADTVLRRQVYSNFIPVLFLFVILLYLLSWKFALVFLIGSLFSMTVRILTAYFSKRATPAMLLEAEKEEMDKTSNILKVMTSIFVFGFSFLAIFCFKLIFNEINIFYTLVLGVGLEVFLTQIWSASWRSKSDSQPSTTPNYFLIFSLTLVALAAVAEIFYPNYQNLTFVLWAISIAGLKIFLLSLLINFLLKKIRILKSSEAILPVSIIILSSASFYLIPHYLFQNDQFNSLRMTLSLGLGLVVAIFYHLIPKESSKEDTIIKILPILALVFSMLLANYLAEYLGIALVITAQISLFWAMLSKEDNNDIIHQNIISTVFGLGVILIYFLIQKTFAFKNSDQITLIVSLLLGGLIPYFVVHYSILISKKPYINLFALISILTSLAIILLFGSLYMNGLIIGILIIGILLTCIYQRAKPILYSALSIIFLLTIILKDFLQTDLSLTFKIIIAGVLLISISAFAIFKPITNE